MHPLLEKIYTTDVDNTPTTAYSYNTWGGSFLNPDKPLFKEAPDKSFGNYSPEFAFSPDGKYNFNFSGNIYLCSKETEEDMEFHSQTLSSMVDMDFDLPNNQFFKAIGRNFIYEYDYTKRNAENNYTQTGAYRTKGEILRLFYRDQQLFCITKQEGKLFLERVALLR